MTHIVFKNPNNPEQPTPGVYGWFLDYDKHCLYIGRSGGKSNPKATPSTLYRRIQEVRRSCISSNKGGALDTDWIVGTAILYFKNRGYKCIWRHIASDPALEREFWLKYNPLLQQHNTAINKEFLSLNQQVAFGDQTMLNSQMSC